MTRGWAPDDRPALREPDRFVYPHLPVPTTEQLQSPESRKLVQEGLRSLVSGKAEVRTDATTLEHLIQAVNTVWQGYARHGRECPAILVWQREAGQAVYANKIPDQTAGVWGGGPNQLLTAPGAYYELAARVLAAGMRPRMLAVANEGWGVNPELPQARIDELEAQRLHGRLRLGNLPPRERAEMWSVYAQQRDPVQDQMRMWRILAGPRGRRILEPLDTDAEGAEVKTRFAPLLAGTTSRYALDD